MQKTLLVSEIFPPRVGGSGRWLWEIYRRMPRGDVVVAAGEHPGHEEFDAAHDVRIGRAPLVWIKDWGIASIYGLKNYLGNYRAVRKIARGHDISQVHCARILPEGGIAWMLKIMHRLPYVCYVHGEELNIGACSRELGLLMRPVLRNVEFLVANSHNTSSILQEQWNVPPERIRVLHPGVDIKVFVPAERDELFRKNIGWNDRPVVLTVSRLQKRKGHDQLIRAIERIRQAVPEVLYAIVGDGEERQALEKLIAELKLERHVQFVGQVSDTELVRCYQQCDLFMLPNRTVDGDFEGFGMVLLEAQACGRPVLAGASGGTAETMRIPETGRVVCCDNVDEIADNVVELMTDPQLRDRMGKAARQWTVKNFGWESLSRQAIQIFEDRNDQ